MSDPLRQPHGNSKLKRTDDPECMEKVYRYKMGDAKATPPIPRHTLVETEAWLAAQDVDTNINSISEFLRWYPLWRQTYLRKSVAETVKELARSTPGLNLDDKQLLRFGQAVFEAQAIETNDPSYFIAIKKLAQKDRQIELQESSAKTRARQKDTQLAQAEKNLSLTERKVVLLEQKIAEATHAVTDSALSPEEKEKRIKAVFGIAG